MILHGDCLEQLKQMEDNSVDALVTDPPAGISFMGKAWDADKGGRKEWVEWMEAVMRECRRVLKPGAHGLVWALPRTSHWTATALEDAGFEIRDCIYHLFGQGFPKSLDVSKAIDKAAGVEGPIVGKNPAFRSRQLEHDANWETAMRPEHKRGPATDAARQWQGWGTALKPAVECWWLVRKPCSEKTVAANVLKWGTGALNIDGSRIEAVDQAKFAKNWDRETITDITGGNYSNGEAGAAKNNYNAPQGRFPSHLILDEEAAALLDEQSLAGGMHSAGVQRSKGQATQTNNGALFGVGNHDGNGVRFGDSGGASRFFYCPKISASERNAGFESDTAAKRMSDARPNLGDMTGKFPDHDHREKRGNHHPTVKPQKLMRYLCRMVTPPGGLVLDPFTGSGSTGVAALSEGFRFVGIEREGEYVAIAEKRISTVTGLGL